MRAAGKLEPTRRAARDPNPAPLVVARFERQLVELGCPARELRRRVRELAEHYQDLEESALGEGLGEGEAGARASRLLGEPVALAQEMALALRQSSWWGRHRIIGYCLLPPLATLVMSLFGLLAGLGLLSVCSPVGEWAMFLADASGSGLASVAVQGACGVSIALTALVFCWLARRSVCGLRWALAACTACSLQSYFCGCRISPRGVWLGYQLSPSWVCWAFPLLVAGVIVLWQKRLEDRLAPLPEETPPKPAGQGAGGTCHRQL